MSDGILTPAQLVAANTQQPAMATVREETPLRRFTRSFLEDRVALIGLAVFTLIVLLEIGRAHV